MAEKVVALETGGIDRHNRVTQIAVIAHQRGNVITDKAAHATGKHNVEVAVEHLERRLDQLIQSLDAAKTDVVFGRVCTRHVTGTGINATLETVFKREECGLLKLAARRAVGDRNSALNSDNSMRCTNCASVSGVRNRITFFLLNCSHC